MKIKRWFCRFLCVLLCVSSLGPLSPEIRVQAADKILTLTQAQGLARSNSAKYQQVLNKIDLQTIKYAAAVKSIAMKKKNMATFRWTPLLSFKFPEQPTLADEYEWQYKPLQITCTINELRHQLNDELLSVKEKVSNLYVEAYVCQTKIDFAKERLSAAEETLKRNRLRLATGEAKQADIDKMEQKIENLNTDLALQQRTFETKKSKISKLIHIDITSGYRLKDPNVTADIPRSALKSITDYTLNHDQGFYETKLETQLLYTSMNMMQSLMRNQYGGKMNIINSYITQAKNGEEINGSTFKAAYNQMLQDIDAKWNGTRRILFIKIKKEWFKGAVDGSRYVEDDPYALYEEALEYADAVREKKAEEEELTDSVKDGFETLVTARNAYAVSRLSCDRLSQEVDKAVLQNQLGELSYDELSEVQNEYEELQVDTMNLLSDYSKLLYSYDRLTCGGVTAYLSGESLEMSASQGGNSYIAQELEGKAYYYIDYRIEDQIFVFGVSIPENYSLNISHFELYVDGTRIGDKTEVSKALEHLALDLDSVNQVRLYLYNESELVSVCEIDTTINQAELEIIGGYRRETEGGDKVVATYSYEMTNEGKMAALTIKPRETENIASYQLTDKNGNLIMGEDKVDVGDSFEYLSLLVGNFEDISAVFYDSAGNRLYVGEFVDATSSIVVREQGSSDAGER